MAAKTTPSNQTFFFNPDQIIAVQQRNVDAVTSARFPLRSTPSSASSVVDVAPKVFAMIVSRSKC